MKRKSLQWIVIFCSSGILAKDEELPLCPAHMAYFPQNLPMHCRMPKMSDFPNPVKMPTMPPMLSNFYKNSDKLPHPPSFPAPLPMPGSLPMPGPMPMPGSLPMPGGFPMAGPMPIPMPMPGSPQKLPVIVMPFYSPDPAYKKSRPRPSHRKERHPPSRKPYYDIGSSSSDTDTSLDTSGSSSERGWWKGYKRGIRRSGRLDKKRKQKNKKRQDLLTPVLQYVTKDGYVIFEKAISKGEAKDWLKTKNEDDDTITNAQLEGGNMPHDPKADIEELDKDLKTKQGKNVESIKRHENKRRHHRQPSSAAKKADQET